MKKYLKYLSLYTFILLGLLRRNINKMYKYTVFYHKRKFSEHKCRGKKVQLFILRSSIKSNERKFI